MPLTLERIRLFFARYQRREQTAAHLKRAGVLVPFFLQDDGLHVLLTKRTETVERHKGQISFPGGMRDTHDTDIIDTALREAEEEIGLPRSAVEILGLFDDFWTPTGYSITPVVGFIPKPGILKPNAEEVDAIFNVPAAFFLDERNERVVEVERDGKPHTLYFFSYGEFEIWGATAAILRALLNAVTAGTSEEGASSIP